MQAVYKMLNYTFRDSKLLQEALTHASCEKEFSYERLEFLGDAVLQLIVTTVLYHRYPEYQEGKLSAARMQLVREEALADWARSKELQKFVILGKAEENNHGREKNSILCDIAESVIGAVYLDGGIEAAKELVLDVIAHFDQKKLQSQDPKTELQELLQQKPGQRIEYLLTDRTGPAHDTVFYFDVLINDQVMGSGSGKSKKAAERAAAQQALSKIKQNF